MKVGKRRPLTLGLILISIFLVSCQGQEIDIGAREGVQEFKELGDYIVFIEEDQGQGLVKLYNKNTRQEEAIQDLRGDFSRLQLAPDESFFLVDEGEGLVRTSHLIPLGDPEARRTLRVIGQPLISPDSDKLLIGVDNLGERKFQGELGDQVQGTVDLLVYYIEKGSIRTLLEAGEDHDYLGLAWDGENRISYKKITEKGQEEKTIKYEAPVEELLMEAVYSGGQVAISKIMAYMARADFDQLEEIHGENSGLEFLEWLRGQEISTKEDIGVLIGRLDDFFGKEYFAYIESLAAAYVDAKLEFIKALADHPEKLEDIGYALNYMRVYDLEGQEIWKDLDKISKTNELSQEEKELGMDLIHFYTQCST